MKRRVVYGMLTGLGLLLAGCGQGDGPELSAAALSGKVRNWQGGPGLLEARAYDYGGAQTLASGPVDSAGSFNLTLPDAVGATLLMNIGAGLEGCGGVTVSAPQAGVLVLFDYEASREGGSIGTVFQASTGNLGSGPPARGTVVAARLYSDRDVSVRGTCSQDGYLAMALSFDLSLRGGWNAVYAEVTEATDRSLAVSIRSGRPPAGVDWYLAHSPAGPVPPPSDVSPSIGYISVDPGEIGNLTATFHWEIYGGSGSPLTCTLDPGDGSPAYVIADCASHTSLDHLYSEPGEYTASFWVEGEDGAGEGAELWVVVGMDEE